MAHATNKLQEQNVVVQFDADQRRHGPTWPRMLHTSVPDLSHQPGARPVRSWRPGSLPFAPQGYQDHICLIGEARPRSLAMVHEMMLAG